MKKILLGMFLLAPVMSLAGPECVKKETKSQWVKETDFQKRLTDDGYKIKKFKVTGGNCYEIYGFDKNNKKVEIYFNPITGEKVKEEVM